MKRQVIVASILLGSLALWALATQPGGSAAEPPASGTLPASLHEHYPPKAKGPMWLVAMIGMGTSFSGMVTDFAEGDAANAAQGYEDFRRRYGELSRMVPEWTINFPSEPVDALGAALESGDPGQFMPAVERVDHVCHTCHVANMTLVQQKFHWGDFRDIALTDPVSKGDVSFPMLMKMLDGDLSGLQVDLAQGQVDKALEHAVGLAARYETLKESCEACHDSERTYYVDSSVTGMIEQLATLLGSDAADLGGVPKLVQGIGMESCHKCHLVHGPAALAKYVGETTH